MAALGQPDPIEIAQFWQRFLAATGHNSDEPQPAAWPFGDSTELANKLLGLVLDGPKRATAGPVAEFEALHEALPSAGDYAIITDGAMRPRAVIQATEVRVGPLSSVDEQFAHDEGEGDRTRDWWLAAHTRAFKRVLGAIGVDFHDQVPTVFQRFELQYQESS